MGVLDNALESVKGLVDGATSPDFLQSLARSLARAPATIAGSPVDAVSAGMDALGIPVGDRPVGGSQWLAEHLEMPQQPGNSVADMGVSMLDPASAASVLGKVAAPVAHAIFAGWRAVNADEKALEAAHQMALAGEAPDKIWGTTGWMIGADKHPRFELDSSQARLQSPLKMDPTQLSQHLSFPALEAAYPGMTSRMGIMHFDANAPEYASQKGLRGFYDHQYNILGVNPNLSDSEKLSTILHELQHKVQETEDFSKGGNMMTPAVRSAAARMAAAENRAPAFTDYLRAYKSLAGEAEARAVQARMDFSAPVRRLIYPADSYDMPFNSLIHTY